MSVPSSDADLAKEALAGSEAASRALVTRYATPAVNFVFRFVRDRALAEDLAQEGFLRVFQKLNTYDPARKFSSWFFQVLRNVTIDYLRVGRPQTSSLEDLADAGFEPASTNRASPSPEHMAAQAELAAAFDDALNELRPDFREVVALRYHEGLTQQEIADIVGLPVGTVKTYLHRARRQLAVTLTSKGWGPS